MQAHIQVGGQTSAHTSLQTQTSTHKSAHTSLGVPTSSPLGVGVIHLLLKYFFVGKAEKRDKLQGSAVRIRS